MPSFGNLFASLTLESASFMSGIKAAQKEIAQTQKTFQQVGAKMQKVGGIMSAAITAPLAGIGAAFIGSARQIAEGIPELEKLAGLANTTTGEFQRLAFAAQTVGFEGDKLGDIYKDVNDKFGEFLSTGGGEMKDFFENVAPKIGLTAEAFRNLSGPDALQLYYNSLEKAGLNQAQMTFYMEALANDATALIPLLRENGKAFDEIGAKAAVVSPEDAASMKAYVAAQKEMDQAFQRLTVAVVSSGLLEAFTGFITQVSDLLSNLSKTNPELLKIGVAVGAVAAVLGPLVVTLGTMVQGLALALPWMVRFSGGMLGIGAASGTAVTGATAAGVAFRFMLGPIALVITAITAAIWAWQNWDSIKPIIDRVIGYVSGLYERAKPWIDRLKNILLTVLNPVEAVRVGFFKLYDAVVGHSYIPDMVDGIGAHMRRLDTEMVKPAAAATSKVDEAFRALATAIQPILDRLFPEQARANQFLSELADLEKGMRAMGATADQTAEAVRRLKDEYYNQTGRTEMMTGADIARNAPGSLDIKSGDIFEQLGEISEATKAEWSKVTAANDNLGASFADMARDVTGSLQGLVNNIRSGDWLSAMSSVLDVVGQIGGIVKGTGAPAIRTYPLAGARANGGPVMPRGDYLVGERGPEILRMGGRRGMIVPNDQIGGGTVIQIVADEGAMFVPRVQGIAGDVSVQTVGASNAAMARMQRRRLGRGG